MTVSFPAGGVECFGMKGLEIFFCKKTSNLFRCYKNVFYICCEMKRWQFRKQSLDNVSWISLYKRNERKRI